MHLHHALLLVLAHPEPDGHQREAVTRLGLDPFDLSGETHRMHALQLADPKAADVFDPKAWKRIKDRALGYFMKLHALDRRIRCIERLLKMPGNRLTPALRRPGALRTHRLVEQTRARGYDAAHFLPCVGQQAAGRCQRPMLVAVYAFRQLSLRFALVIEQAEVEAYLDSCIAANLQRPLKSRAFLRLSP